MSRITLALLLVVICTAPALAQAPTPAPDDSLLHFFKGLADSTDESYGEQSVTFDTTGIDSLAAFALTNPPAIKRRRPGVFAWAPVLGFHRAEGVDLGLGIIAGTKKSGYFLASGYYGFSNKEGRYDFGYRKTLFEHSLYAPRERLLEPRIRDRLQRLDVNLRYARQTLGFMPEHADPDLGGIGAIISNSNSQSVYERRGLEGWLSYWTGDFRIQAGYRDAKEQAMPIVTDWSFFGDADAVPYNQLADADEFSEPFGGIAYWRSDWEFGARIDARGDADRWRLRTALAKAFRLGEDVKSFYQFEAGAAAYGAPIQRMFEIGGAKAVPSMRYGIGDTDHMMLGTAEFIERHDALKALHLPHPEWFILQPSVFVHGGAVWNDPGGRDVLFSMPPGTAWKGAAGAGLVFRLGIPDPDTVWRMYFAWPIGPESGVARFNFSLSTGYSLLGRI